MSDAPRQLAHDLEALKAELQSIQYRLSQINQRLDQIGIPAAPEPPATPAPVQVPPESVPPPLPTSLGATPVRPTPLTPPPLSPTPLPAASAGPPSPRPVRPSAAPPPLPEPIPAAVAVPPILAAMAAQPAAGHASDGGPVQAGPRAGPRLQGRPEPVSRLEPEPVSEPFEVRLGTYWLPRIGMGLLLLGMVFLVTWTYRYMGPAGKVILSYSCCALLGGLGWWLDKRMPGLARVIQAGALALTYFVSYATHYVPAFRVIDNPWVALGLLLAVVALIVVVADRQRSATLAGLALFFGYLTTVISGVDQFTLAANAVLAGAALVFLARNRWVGLGYGAVLATYLVYVIWAWNNNPFDLFERFLFAGSYLGAEAFRLRAGFLSLYWLLFTIGGLLVGRAALGAAERSGLLTLNNALFFVSFWLLMHHAHPGRQWAFLFGYSGALLVAAALAHQRFGPDRLLRDTLLGQAIAVATLGLISKLAGANLVGVLAIESLMLLWLGRLMGVRWVDWMGRAVFGVAAWFAFKELPGWPSPMVHGAALAAVAGYVGARLSRRPEPSVGAFYFALLGTLLAMAAVAEQFNRGDRSWAWPVLAVVVGLAGWGLRTREVIWLANLPLAWAHVSFQFGNVELLRPEWELGPALALVNVTLGFGLVVWGKARAEQRNASQALLPYAVLAVLALLGATVVQWPSRWRLAALALESLGLLLAGLRLREPVLRGLALVPLAWAHLTFLAWNMRQMLYTPSQALTLVAASFAAGLLLWGRERAQEPSNPERADEWLWPLAGAAVLALGLTVFEFVPVPWRLAVLAAAGTVLMLSGVRVFGWLGLAVFAVAVLSYVGTRATQLGAAATAWGNAGIALLLLLLSARVLRVRQAAAGWRAGIIALLTVLAFYAVSRLVAPTLVTVGWAVAGFLLLALGFGVRERPYRLGGLSLLGCAVVRVMLYDLAKVETIYRILSFLGLGAILLVLAYLYTKNREKIAQWL